MLHWPTMLCSQECPRSVGPLVFVSISWYVFKLAVTASEQYGITAVCLRVYVLRALLSTRRRYPISRDIIDQIYRFPAAPAAPVPGSDRFPKLTVTAVLGHTHSHVSYFSLPDVPPLLSSMLTSTLKVVRGPRAQYIASCCAKKRNPIPSINNQTIRAMLRIGYGLTVVRFYSSASYTSTFNRPLQGCMSNARPAEHFNLSLKNHESGWCSSMARR